MLICCGEGYILKITKQKLFKSTLCLMIVAFCSMCFLQLCLCMLYLLNISTTYIATSNFFIVKIPKNCLMYFHA